MWCGGKGVDHDCRSRVVRSMLSFFVVRLFRLSGVEAVARIDFSCIFSRARCARCSCLDHVLRCFSSRSIRGGESDIVDKWLNMMEGGGCSGGPSGGYWPLISPGHGGAFFSIRSY